MLTGPNGAGKTNLLEAVSMLAPGRGLRRAQRGEIGHFSEQLTQNRTDRTKEVQGASWSVFAELSGPEGVVAVGTGQALNSQMPAARGQGEWCRQCPDRLARLVTLSWLTPRWMVCLLARLLPAGGLLTVWRLLLIRHIAGGCLAMKKLAGTDTPAQ